MFVLNAKLWAILPFILLQTRQQLNNRIMGTKQSINHHIERMQRKIDDEKEKRKVLREMELFVLDNSLRESTVGQLRGHTIENKWKIYEQVDYKLKRN